MEMTRAEASKKLRNLIEYYNLSRCVEIPGDIPVVEVPIDAYDIIALQIAIESLGASEPVTTSGKIRKDAKKIMKEGDQND